MSFIVHQSTIAAWLHCLHFVKSFPEVVLISFFYNPELFKNVFCGRHSAILNANSTQEKKYNIKGTVETTLRRARIRVVQHARLWRILERVYI
jgi:hypothetical protein